MPESLRTQTLKLVQAKYSDFGPTLACEYLAKEHEVEVSKETLRQGHRSPCESNASSDASPRGRRSAIPD